MKFQIRNLACWTLVTALVMATTATQAAAQTISWSRQIGNSSNDRANSVSADGLGNVYIAGLTAGDLFGPNAGGSGNRFDAFLAKYDPAGTLLWGRQFGTGGDSGDNDIAWGVSADGHDNVYVAGYTDGDLYPGGSDGKDAFLAKYDPAGTLLWGRQFGTDMEDSLLGMSMDGLGNVYVAGYTQPAPLVFERDGFLSKFDEAGIQLWSQQWGTAENVPRSVSADGLGNVYVAGRTSDDEAFLSRFDASGTLLWTEPWAPAPGNENSGHRELSTGSLGNVYVTGKIAINPGPDLDRDAYLLKYNTSGAPLWTEQVDSGDWDQGRGVATDGLGNVYLLGMTEGNLGGQNAGGWDAFVRKYDASGTPIWTQQWGTGKDDRVSGASADGLGNLYVAGSTGNDIFLLKLSETGDFDENGELNANDIDLLSAAIRDAPYEQIFDLNKDMSLDDEDRRIWVEDIFGTLFGDANLNQVVQFEDFVALADAFGGQGGWATGDFDGDSIVQFPDFVLLADNFGKPAVQAPLAEVPEPPGFALACIVGLAFVRVGSALRRRGRCGTHP